MPLSWLLPDGAGDVLPEATFQTLTPDIQASNMAHVILKFTGTRLKLGASPFINAASPMLLLTGENAFGVELTEPGLDLTGASVQGVVYDRLSGVAVFTEAATLTAPNPAILSAPMPAFASPGFFAFSFVATFPDAGTPFLYCSFIHIDVVNP